MQIFIALNTNFLTFEPSAKEWIKEYCYSLSTLGFECVLFDGSAGKIPEKAIVHFFSCFDAETWKVLAETDRFVVVTPSLNSTIKSVFFDWICSSIDLFIKNKILWMKGTLTEVVFRKYGCHYLVTSESTKNQIIRFWGVDQNKVSIFGKQPDEAAIVASRLYNQLSST